MSAMDRNSTKGSSLDGRNPRRRQKSAASASTAFTTSARPPMSWAAATQRSRACFRSPEPMPFPFQASSVASCPSSKQGTGSGGWPVRIERGSTEGYDRRRREPVVTDDAIALVDNDNGCEPLLLVREGACLATRPPGWACRRKTRKGRVSPLAAQGGKEPRDESVTPARHRSARVPAA